MKNVFVLVLVLGVASLTSATVTLDVSSNTVIVGGTVTISVSSDDGSAYGRFLDMVKGTATLGDVTIYPAAGEDALVTDHSEHTTGSLYDFELIAMELDPAAPIQPVVAGLHFSVVATATGAVVETFTVELLNFVTYEVEDSETVTIIPEPATLLLFSLGAVMLRRKLFIK